jgi:polysaccharide export outer membrane protein
MHILFVVRNYLLTYLFALIGIAFLFSSCGNIRQLVYMQGKFDTAKLSQLNATEPIIRKGDLLSIIVFSDNPDATKIYNQSVITVGGSAAGGSGGASQGVAGVAPAAPGYQVDENGDIVFQGLGILHVEGLTKAQLKDTLDSRLRKFLTNPYYNIRFLNYKFTMLGEVNKPGVFSVPGEKINLWEALSLAGDMTFYGRRDNVLVIREINGKREFNRLDLTKPEVMLSPYFYLQQNDLVIFEPNNKKYAANDAVTSRNISLGLAIVSTIAVLYSIFRK